MGDENSHQNEGDCRFLRLLEAYRRHGHKYASVNPISLQEHIDARELDCGRFGLSLEEEVSVGGTNASLTVQEAVNILKSSYCGSISAEFMHLEDDSEIEWFASQMESLRREKLDAAQRKRIGVNLLKSQAFDRFLASKFSGLKRYGGEGAESMLVFFDRLIDLSSEEQLHLVIGMPHRGRLNLLTGVLQMPPARLFQKLQGLPEYPERYKATGDVISHLISSTTVGTEKGSTRISVLYNPSHLEAVNPVSMGKTRAKHQTQKLADYGNDESSRFGDKVVNIQLHGDAALAGQGVNQECLMLSRAPHFECGGTIHLVVNNQLGFTTPAEIGRSSRYCTDIAKIIDAPVIHVNGDDPEMVFHSTKIAFLYQRLFRKDVFIDMNCYRQWGHNELDDPTLTNPELYGIIHSKKTVPDHYANILEQEGVLRSGESSEISQEHVNWLGEQLQTVSPPGAFVPEQLCFKQNWEGYDQAPDAVTLWDTGVTSDVLAFVGDKSVAYPDEFNLHPQIVKSFVQPRLAKLQSGDKIDWATAESLAFGSLLLQGHPVRISGQDVGRGTFSHRHVMVVDQKNNTTYVPLNHMSEDQTSFLEVANSILSEEAVLGFEYGMSVEDPNNLVIWETQFGDFFNGAQIMVDTFVASGETKWLWSCGLVILLPHGYDGAGPEHSSCRMERFLQLTDSCESRVDGDHVNIQVVQPSTPAQYFHLLRRQVLRNYRKPLIVVAPKTLLRLSAATSTFEEMSPGTTFQTVIGDSHADVDATDRVIVCSGKHYYTLMDKKAELKIKNTAIVRLESLCPFPTLELRREVDKYHNAKVFMWSQEEPRNMGAWSFVKPRFENLIGHKVVYAGRPTLAAPAVGISKIHNEQLEQLLKKTFDPVFM